MKTGHQRIAISLLETNKGQIEGLPANPRQWTKAQFEQLKASIKETPELLEARGCIVDYHDGKYVCLGGNMRYMACKDLGMTDVPCYVIPEGTSVLKKKEIVAKDNVSMGEWDYDALANEWGDLDLEGWGVPIPEWGIEQNSGAEGNDASEDDNDECPEVPRDPHVEELLNEAMRENASEYVKQLEILLPHGWLRTGLTLGFCKAQFLKAKYYGKRYPRSLSLYFTPQQLCTSANTRSIYDQLKKTAKEGKAGIAGLRTVTSDGDLNQITTSSSYPIGGGRLPLDFPAELAKELIDEFAPNGNILDPCHGWGGRLVGALLAGVKKYTGVDPSPEAHAGVSRIKDAYLPYCHDTTEEVNLIEECFENCTFKEESFDFALTSPPYFDVEQYHGEKQAHSQYPQYELWREKFYKPLIYNTFKYLKRGGVFALQVGGQSYPLIADGIRIAKEAGFRVERRTPNNLLIDSKLHNTDENKAETLLILTKMNE